jgi:hypothetical protein
MPDPVVSQISDVRQKLLADAGGSVSRLMDLVRRHERAHPQRFFTFEEWERTRAASQGRLPTEWLYIDPIVAEVRASRDHLASAHAELPEH